MLARGESDMDFCREKTKNFKQETFVAGEVINREQNLLRVMEKLCIEKAIFT